MKAIISEDLNFISAFNSVKKSFRENEILTSLFVAVGEGDDRKGEARRGERHRREGDHNKNSINYYQFCKMVTLNKFQKSCVVCLDIKSQQAIFLSFALLVRRSSLNGKHVSLKVDQMRLER